MQLLAVWSPFAMLLLSSIAHAHLTEQLPWTKAAVFVLLHESVMYTKSVLEVVLWYLAAQGAKEAGPEEGGAVGADSDEEEKRAVRARAANADQSSTAEGRNQSAAADVGFDCLTHVKRCMLNTNFRCGF